MLLRVQPKKQGGADIAFYVGDPKNYPSRWLAHSETVRLGQSQSFALRLEFLHFVGLWLAGR